MSKKPIIAAALLTGLACLTGCTVTGPNTGPFGAGILALPIPVSPFYQKKLEDKFWEHERYERVPILGPVTSGAEPVALDPPTPDEVMRALEPSVEGGLPFLHEVQRNKVRMTIDPIADYIDPPRFYPLIGWAQLHHAHYKCTLFYEEVTWVGWPFPYKTTDEDASEVIYIDHNHFHMVGHADGGRGTHYAAPPE